MTVAFIGHSLIRSYTEVKKKVKEQLKSLVDQTKITKCYIGRHGDFDEICTTVCAELKHEGYDIEVVYVTSYLSLTEQKRIKAKAPRLRCFFVFN